MSDTISREVARRIVQTTMRHAHQIDTYGLDDGTLDHIIAEAVAPALQDAVAGLDSLTEEINRRFWTTDWTPGHADGWTVTLTVDAAGDYTYTARLANLGLEVTAPSAEDIIARVGEADRH